MKFQRHSLMQPGKLSKISFYIVAHADDWQLFMQPNAFNDLMDDTCKVVFIVTTAGDAGGEEKFWLAREEGMKSSLRFCFAPLGTIIEKNESVELNGHTITCCPINKTMTYFFRLPDGNLDSKGFPRYGHQGLARLRAEQVIPATAVDRSTTYITWRDFCGTLQEVIAVESGDINDRGIHYLNPDPKANFNDHPDHILTGKAVQSIDNIITMRQYLYVGYSVGNASKQLAPEEMFWKAAMFAAYEKAVFDSSGYSTLREGVPVYMNWFKHSAEFIVKAST